nr:leucine-rich repeat protein [Prevotella sp.]
MKHLLLFVLTLFCALTIDAQTFVTVDNVRYLIEDDHAVVARQDKELAGNIIIPTSIEYDNTSYNVTRLMNPGDSESGGGGAFLECEITSISLPASITEIPDQTFYGCMQLSSVTIPGPVTSIGYNAFESCESLTSIDLPDDVTEMRASAFYNSGLTEFKIPAGVTRLEDGVLAETKITYLEIPETVSSFAMGCFKTHKTDEEGQPLKRTVKMLQRDCRLVSFDDDALYGKYGVPSMAFGDMTKIDLLVPAGGKVVYQEYFPWMYMNSITEYGEDTGEPLVTDQRHVTIDNIRYMLKNGETNEAYVDIQPETLSGDVVIPKEVTYGGVNYPVTSVMGGYAMEWHEAGNGEMEPVLSGAFTNTQVTKVTLPASIKNIELWAFTRAQNLQEVTLNEGITDIANYAFENCPELTTINIPSTVTSLPCSIFRWCPNLKAITLNEGLTSIEGGAFYDSGLETLTIPSTCTAIGGQSLLIFNPLTLYMKVKEPTDLLNATTGLPINNSIFDNYYEGAQAIAEHVDLIVPLGCAESYQMQSTWTLCRSVTDEGCPYLKLDNSVFSAPNGAFSVTNTENDGEPEFEQHDGDYEEAYTHGLCLKEGTAVSFSTAAENSQVYVYLFSNNNSTVKLDDTEITVIGDDQSDAHSYRRYDMQVGPGEHIITCSDYEGDEWPCMFLLQVKDESGEYYHPREEIVTIDGIRYRLEETVNEQNETVRTATVARQKTSLSGDIVIPEKVTYAKTVLQGDEWVTLDACDYDVTAITLPAGQSYAITYDGAFQDCQITSISLPATITAIPVGAFNGCQKLKKVTLPETIETVGGSAFANCTSLEEIYLPESIKGMGMFIFWNCSSLKKVNIPKQVTILGMGAFLNSGIETFIIPENITIIDDDCFATYGEEKCLKSIKICRKTYSDGDVYFPESMFNDVSGITLFVPEGTKETLYSQVYPWKKFDNIIEYKDQNDLHQYNAYRVAYTEEILKKEPAGARRRSPSAGENTTTLGYIPSGVLLPEGNVKEGYALIEWQMDGTPVGEDARMPAQDIVLKGIFALKGDVNGDGKVTPADAIMILYQYFNVEQKDFLEKAAD